MEKNLNHFSVHLKVTQHCKLTILQLLKIRDGISALRLLGGHLLSVMWALLLPVQMKSFCPSLAVSSYQSWAGGGVRRGLYHVSQAILGLKPGSASYSLWDLRQDHTVNLLEPKFPHLSNGNNRLIFHSCFKNWIKQCMANTKNAA